jgi:hypothetical protein
MKININNHIYATTLKMGGDGTFFSSLKMDNGDVKEIRKNSFLFSSAYDLPQNPTNEEIEDLFPINYSYYKLKNFK